jgi:hemerythrin-like domain-containing protein
MLFISLMMSDPANLLGVSSAARDAILAQHEEIRGLARNVSELARLSTANAEAGPSLRTEARALCATLDEHMRFEESVLEVALRDVISRGAELHAEIERDHQSQRAIITTAMAEIGRPGPPSEELVGSLRRFVDLLLRDLDAEEQVLLSADVDALMTDGEAGD